MGAGGEGREKRDAGRRAAWRGLRRSWSSWSEGRQGDRKNGRANPTARKGDDAKPPRRRRPRSLAEDRSFLGSFLWKSAPLT